MVWAMRAVVLTSVVQLVSAFGTQAPSRATMRGARRWWRGECRAAAPSREQDASRRASSIGSGLSFAFSSWFAPKYSYDGAGDYYADLRVAADATLAQIRAAYRERVATCHPDVDPSESAATEYAQLKVAYECLRDAKKREAYDGSRAVLAFARAAEQFVDDVAVPFVRDTAVPFVRDTAAPAVRTTATAAAGAVRYAADAATRAANTPVASSPQRSGWGKAAFDLGAMVGDRPDAQGRSGWLKTAFELGDLVGRATAAQPPDVVPSNSERTASPNGERTASDAQTTPRADPYWTARRDSAAASLAAEQLRLSESSAADARLTLAKTDDETEQLLLLSKSDLKQRLLRLGLDAGGSKQELAHRIIAVRNGIKPPPTSISEPPEPKSDSEPFSLYPPPRATEPKSDSEPFSLYPPPRAK